MPMSQSEDFVAEADTDIEAPIDRVWRALVDPVQIKQYMFGTEVISDWVEGGPIRWKGVWDGRAYEDKGSVLRVDEPHLLRLTHFSPLTGEPDVPENYHTLIFELTDAGGSTHISLTQDNNPSEEARLHSARNWQAMLESMKELLEADGAGS
jgi:uncharacterized protein YndB with AHSA1/START domain